MSSIYNLTPTTIRLWALLEHNHVVTYEMIEKYFGTSNGVIQQLRKVIGKDKIITIIGTGYYLDP